MSVVHLGYVVGSGEPVAIPIAHMLVSGMTQQSGKTTTLEALISRSGLRAITFVTKRGELAFAQGRRIPPYFRERADWVFVSSLIDATLGEKNKLLRAWLMRVCRNTRTLAEVQENVRAARASAKGFSESIYTEIEGYLDLVVPQLTQLPPAQSIAIGTGLNVMDLSPYSTELQALVIRSVLEHVYESEQGVITVIPEAWEFLPEGRGSPVKREAETLIRKGAALGNFVWLDSQDLAGVWKTAVRAASVCLVGVQREANEIKRTLANIPAGIAKPKAGDIATLDRGQFFACWGRHAVKTYVQPAWLTDAEARAIATGAVPPESLAEYAQTRQPVPEETTDMSASVEKKLDTLIELMTQSFRPSAMPKDAPEKIARRAEESVRSSAGTIELSPPHFDEEAIYRRFRDRLLKEPAVLKVLATVPEIHVSETREVIEIDGRTLRGRLALFISQGFFDQPKTGHAAYNELRRVGFATAKPNVYRELDTLATLGFLTKEPDAGFQAVPGMKRNIVKK